MDHSLSEFNKLRRQWSNYVSFDEEYRPHDKKLVAKIGVAWVTKTPGTNFADPLGWEVEIIDTPVGISERSHKLLKWLRNPPPQFFDSIITYGGEDLDLFSENTSFVRSKRSRRISPKFFPQDEPDHTFSIPPNEYEVFKKACCECKERSFKNTSTNYDLDTTTNYDLNLKNGGPYSVVAKTPHMGIFSNTSSKGGKKLSTSANHDIHSDVERELYNHLLDDNKKSSIIGTPSKRNHHHRKHRSRTSNLSNKSVETSRVHPISGEGRLHNERTPRRERTASLLNETIQKRIDNQHHMNQNTMKQNHNGQRRRSGDSHNSEHIPSIAVFEDNSLDRRTTLEDFKEHDFFKTSLEEDDFVKKTNGIERINEEEEIGANGLTRINYVPSDYDLN